MFSFGPQVMNGPCIGDNEQDNECIQDALFAKSFVSHVLKNLTSLASESTRVVEVLIGSFQLFSLTTHLTECFIPNLLGRSTQPEM